MQSTREKLSWQLYITLDHLQLKWNTVGEVLFVTEILKQFKEQIISLHAEREKM